MKEEEPLNFIKNHKENVNLEYKLKPNFNEIQNNIKEITNRMHFNILKTIYAFANTEGGELYVGIEDKNSIVKSVGDTDRKRVEGLDHCDIEIIEQILKQVNPIIKVEKKERIKLKNGRIVIKIQVNKLNVWDKPLFVDGILYVREGNKTKKINSFKSHPLIYEDKQLYMCIAEGIKSNLKKLNQSENFDAQQFIEGLKLHMKYFIKKNKLRGYEEALIKAEDLLDKIRQKIIDQKSKSKEASPITSPLDLDLLINEFIKVYKNIISNRV